MLKYTVFASLALLFACTSQPEETVDFDDLAPTSERYKDDRKDTTEQVVITDERPKNSLFLSIVDTLMYDASWKNWDTSLYVDRFGSKEQEKWIATGKNDSLVLLHYEFRDSSMTKNTFFNWIDCFGPKCKSYVVGDNIRIPRRNALVLVGEKRMIVIEGNRPVNEKTVRETLLLQKTGKARLSASQLKKEHESENWLYIVTIPKAGKTSWKRIEKGEEKPIIRINENN
jgi:hypothetical protein